MRIENILLTTDFSENARLAYWRAGDLARRFSATIHLVHFAGMEPMAFTGVPSDEDYAALEQGLVAEATMHPQLREQKVETALVRGRWTVADMDALQSQRDIDIVVMATHGRTGLRHFVLGSFADRMVRNTKSPILVCHVSQLDKEFQPMNVLVPYDFSKASQAVLPAVRFLAEHYGSVFQFYFADEPVPAKSHALTETIRDLLVETSSSSEGRFEKLFRTQLPGINATWSSTQGPAGREILARAADTDCDLILLGTHGVLGSVAQEVSRAATCDVLTMR